MGTALCTALVGRGAALKNDRLVLVPTALGLGVLTNEPMPLMMRMSPKRREERMANGVEGVFCWANYCNSVK